MAVEAKDFPKSTRISDTGDFKENRAETWQKSIYLRLMKPLPLFRCRAELAGLDSEKVNVNGGAVAFGHPIGASGARIIITLIHELKRRGGGIGIAAICSGGGQGDAVMIEVPRRERADFSVCCMKKDSVTLLLEVIF